MLFLISLSEITGLFCDLSAQIAPSSGQLSCKKGSWNYTLTLVAVMRSPMIMYPHLRQQDASLRQSLSTTTGPFVALAGLSSL